MARSDWATSRRWAIGLAAALLCLSGCSRGDGTARGPGEIVFSILPTGPAAALSQTWAPVIADMEKATGLKVTPYIAPDYAGMVDAMAAGKTDAGWFSNEAGLEAVRRAGGEVFARTLGPNGIQGYNAVLIVRAGSPLTLDRILKCDRTLSFGDGEPISTSGHVVPIAYLFDDHPPPAKCFKSVRVAGSAANLKAVADGTLDAAIANTLTLNNNQTGGATDYKKVKVVWTSITLPEDPMIWRKKLDPAVKEKLRQFFLTYGQGDTPDAARQRTLLAALHISGFEAADDTHLLVAREIEARSKWVEAKWEGDAAKVKAAKARLDDITTQRLAVEARTRAPAANQ